MKHWKSLGIALGVWILLMVWWRFNAPAPAPIAAPDPTEAVRRPARPVRPAARPNVPPTVPLAATAPNGESPAPPTNSTWQRIMAGDPAVSRLSPEQISAFLARNQTNAESLLAAYQVSRDRSLLAAAVTNFPGNPGVLLNAVAHDVVPENRRQWLEQLKQADPDNPLADYLSARDHLKNQETEAAIQDLLAATQKGDFEDYTLQKMQSLEELYLEAGKPPAEAKALAMSGVLLPHLQQLRDLSKDMRALQQQYTAAGDAASAESMAHMGVTLGRQLSAGEGADYLLSQLVGLVVEKDFLAQLEPDQTYGFLQQPVKTRLEDIERERTGIKQSAQNFERWLGHASEPEIISFFDRLKLYGESAALAWLQNRQAAP